ncbi:MAG TPA: glycoside hydrolase family 3 C-terminal domain-containing protein, partial [Anaerolinea sp.]|nr:glycoside hydrolase family 3 C-terminal domain-containing protein [Anaerolinea sp.]
LRVLRQQVRFAQGRDPIAYPREVAGCAAHRQVAREAAEKAIVLLKNEGGLLPLKTVDKLAVIGRLAATPNTGDGGSSNTRPEYVVTPLQGLQEALRGQAEIVYADGSDLTHAVQISGAADVVVLVVGYTDRDEGEFVSPDSMAELSKNFPPPTPEELPIAQAMMANMTSTNTVANAMPPGGDRHVLTLHPEDEELIRAVAAVNPRVVVAMMGGSAIITENWRGLVPSILMLWYPGMEGGHAFADILLGKVNPSGKLPCVFAKRPEDYPYYDMNARAITYDLWHGYRKLERDGVAPAFPFGFGLSYT